MLNWNHTFNVSSSCFQKNIFIFHKYNIGLNTQTGKGSVNKIPNHKGSGRDNIQNSPLALTFFHRISKIFSVNSLNK